MEAETPGGRLVKGPRKRWDSRAVKEVARTDLDDQLDVGIRAEGSRECAILGELDGCVLGDVFT